ncbi:leucine-rich repeat-containing protein 75A isoform X1 [Ascaphus truei]|uniref:leucine-rich repeat-containing protein 75A isoform X1 n=1 Tax=Ascaphus truei TaxID=8439 RepID=UPI003F5A20BE
MGTKQTKVCQASSAGGDSPQHLQGSRRSNTARERGDFWSSLGVRSGDKFGRSGAGSLPPYHKRIRMIQDMMMLVRQGRQDEATELLRHLRQDLGMESTSLDDVLYRYASFRNLVDPITHDLIISLARYVHCPKQEGDSLGAMEKVCRQLTYHLSPHSQWRRQGIVKRKPQACLKAILTGKTHDSAVDLSGIPLTMKDLDRIVFYLQQNSEHLENVELCFTEITDEMFLQLMPVLSALPHLSTLALNGNRLTKAILREITEALKDPKKFPSMTWIDLGNNVDIFSLPQAFLLSLKKRCPKQGNLPTILEFGEGQLSDLENQDGSAENQDEQMAGGFWDQNPQSKS